MTEEREILSLYELNGAVRMAINRQLPARYWVRAELSEVHPNRNGHCYLEFVEKDEQGKNIVAKARGIVFANIYALLRPHFEEQAHTLFAAGIKVLVNVSVEFNEVYGISLQVWDIDPTFTVGDMVRKRMQILQQLQAEGVLHLNKELPIPQLCQRIAVISSATAAGYEDFCHQLHNNPYKLTFYPKLFPAVMQGERTEESVIQALERVYRYAELFDVVVLIRGGGASSDLNSFDSYPLASHIAQFPLPVILGIGHERDVTVLDEVVHTRTKTPTAAATLLIEHQAEQLAKVEALQQDIALHTRQILQIQKTNFQKISQQLIYEANTASHRENTKLEQLQSTIPDAMQRFLEGKRHQLQLSEQYIQLVSPENVLKKGYALLTQNGRFIKSARQLSQGQDIVIQLSDGTVSAKVETSSSDGKN